MTDTTDEIRILIAAKTAEIEAMFATVEMCQPSAYVEIPAPQLDGQPNEAKVFFGVIDSSGIIPPGRGRSTRDRYPKSAEEAYANWVRNMDGWLSDNPSRGTLFWRRKPELESDKDFETKSRHWNVYSRLATLPA